jgi:hypothetical protein
MPCILHQPLKNRKNLRIFAVFVVCRWVIEREGGSKVAPSAPLLPGLRPVREPADILSQPLRTLFQPDSRRRPAGRTNCGSPGFWGISHPEISSSE